MHKYFGEATVPLFVLATLSAVYTWGDHITMYPYVLESVVCTDYIFEFSVFSVGSLAFICTVSFSKLSYILG